MVIEWSRTKEEEEEDEEEGFADEEEGVEEEELVEDEDVGEKKIWVFSFASVEPIEKRVCMCGKI